MNWIKVFHDLPDKPAVHQMAATLNLTPEDVVGRLVRLWVWADQTATVNDDGDAEIGTAPASLLDGVARHVGFSAAMESAGWLRRDGAKIVLPGYGRHNGDTARVRALNAERQARHREREKARNALRNALHNDEVTGRNALRNGQVTGTERELEGDKSKTVEVDNTTPLPPCQGESVSGQVATQPDKSGQPPLALVDGAPPTKPEPPRRQRKAFVPPTVEEVAAYCRERSNGIDANSFVDHYQTRDWIPKGYTRQMCDWKAAVRTWEAKRNGAAPAGQPAAPAGPSTKVSPPEWSEAR